METSTVIEKNISVPSDEKVIDIKETKTYLDRENLLPVQSLALIFALSSIYSETNGYSKFFMTILMAYLSFFPISYFAKKAITAYNENLGRLSYIYISSMGCVALAFGIVVTKS